MVKIGKALSRRSFIGLAAATSTLALVQPLSFETAYGVTAAEKKAEAQAALKKLNALEEKLDLASADYYTAVDEQKEAQSKMDKAQKRIDKANDQISELQGQISTRVRSMYRTGSATFLDLLLGATSFQAFTTNWDILNTMNDNDTDMVKQTKELRSEVQEQRDLYAEQESVAAEKAKEAERIKKEAENLVAETQATYDSLSAEAERLLEEEKKAEEEAEQRRQEQLEAQRAAAAAAASSSSSSGSSESSSEGSSGSSSSSTNDSKSQTVPGSTVVERAYAHLGLPYSWGATGPNAFDCSGFVSMCLSGQYGVRLGTTYTFMGWTRVSNPQPGDVCTNSHHCGIYIGGGQMIHAPHTGDVVKISAVHSDMIYVRY